MANLYAPPRADPSPHTLTQTILTDLDAMRQQLVPFLRWTFYDHHDDTPLGTLAARLLMARWRNYRRKRDQFWSLCGAPPKWRSISHAWASRIWALSKTSFRRRGTLYGQSGINVGRLEQNGNRHPGWFCPALHHIRKDQLFSITSASSRLPEGPQRQLIATLLDIALHWTPLDERAHLWTGMFMEPQRAVLHP